MFSAWGYVLFDDTVPDKHHSRRIELVRRQYSGSAHGVIAGIGLVTCVYVNPDTDQFWLIDYHLFAPDVDGKRKLFRVLVSIHRTDYLVTNEAEPRDTAAAEHESSVRWTIEQFHRERRQLTGVQACLCRLARSQRNHIALTVRAWTRLKQAVYQTQQMVYQLKQGFLDAYMKCELIKPALAFA